MRESGKRNKFVAEPHSPLESRYGYKVGVNHLYPADKHNIQESLIKKSIDC